MMMQLVLDKPFDANVGLDVVRRALRAVWGTAAQEAYPAPTQPAAPAVPLAQAAAARGPILLVEDNLINQKVVVGLLRKRGYLVEIANHGLEAINMLNSRPFQLVLMDIQMPVLDGLQATARIRADRRFTDLPIIAMTAHAMNGDRERCLNAGMDEYIAKPVDHSRLLALIDRFLEQRASQALTSLASAVEEHVERETPTH
jgi:CheY-like chemotaxis protein